jgi:hypothetical protein
MGNRVVRVVYGFVQCGNPSKQDCSLVNRTSFVDLSNSVEYLDMTTGERSGRAWLRVLISVSIAPSFASNNNNSEVHSKLLNNVSKGRLACEERNVADRSLVLVLVLSRLELRRSRSGVAGILSNDHRRRIVSHRHQDGSSLDVCIP